MVFVAVSCSSEVLCRDLVVCCVAMAQAAVPVCAQLAKGLTVQQGRQLGWKLLDEYLDFVGDDGKKSCWSWAIHLPCCWCLIFVIENWQWHGKTTFIATLLWEEYIFTYFTYVWKKVCCFYIHTCYMLQLTSTVPSIISNRQGQRSSWASCPPTSHSLSLTSSWKLRSQSMLDVPWCMWLLFMMGRINSIILLDEVWWGLQDQSGGIEKA